MSERPTSQVTTIPVLVFVLLTGFPEAQETGKAYLIDYTKLRTDAFTVLEDWFGVNHANYNLLEPKPVDGGRILMAGKTVCSGMFVTDAVFYSLDVSILPKKVRLGFQIETVGKKQPSKRCIRLANLAWDEIANQIKSQLSFVRDLKDAPLHPDVAPGKGFHKLPFGTRFRDSFVFLEQSGYVRGSVEVFERPERFAGHYFAVEGSTLTCIVLSVPMEDKNVKAILDFDGQKRFHAVSIQLPDRSVKDYDALLDRDCAFLEKAFDRLFGRRAKSSDPSLEEILETGRSEKSRWKGDGFLAQVSACFGSKGLYASGVIRHDRKSH